MVSVLACRLKSTVVISSQTHLENIKALAVWQFSSLLILRNKKKIKGGFQAGPPSFSWKQAEECRNNLLWSPRCKAKPQCAGVGAPTHRVKEQRGIAASWARKGKNPSISVDLRAQTKDIWTGSLAQNSIKMNQIMSIFRLWWAQQVSGTFYLFLLIF